MSEEKEKEISVVGNRGQDHGNFLTAFFAALAQKWKMERPSTILCTPPNSGGYNLHSKGGSFKANQRSQRHLTQRRKMRKHKGNR